MLLHSVRDRDLVRRAARGLPRGDATRKEIEDLLDLFEGAEIEVSLFLDDEDGMFYWSIIPIEASGDLADFDVISPIADIPPLVAASRESGALQAAFDLYEASKREEVVRARNLLLV